MFVIDVVVGGGGGGGGGSVMMVVLVSVCSFERIYSLIPVVCFAYFCNTISFYLSMVDCITYSHSVWPVVTGVCVCALCKCADF